MGFFNFLMFHNAIIFVFKVDDGFFNFLMIDNINQKLSHFDEFWSAGKQAGFQVYVAEVKADAGTCAKRNVHNRTEKEIQQVFIFYLFCFFCWDLLLKF